MTTAAQPQTENDGWQIHNLPELWKWEKVGQEMTGRLVAIDIVDVKDKVKNTVKKTTQYIFQSESGSGLVKMLATWDLSQKILPSHKGLLLHIKYVGKDDSIQKNGNSMMLFEVKSRKVTARPGETDLTITDDDIPF